MEINRALMELVRREWLISPDGILAYAPIVHKILNGQSVDMVKSTKSIVSIIDDNGRNVNANPDGSIATPKGSVAIIDMVGPVMKYGDWCSYGAIDIVNAMKAADRNPNIIGTVFNQDCPGGAVSAIGPFIEFGKTKTKPVVGLADQSASLAFWALCAVADYRMADNSISAAFGSVGVVSTFADNRKYLETLGYVFHEIYSDLSQHKNEAFTMALAGDYDLIKKEHLNPIALKFQDTIRATTPNLIEEVGVLTGKTFSAEDAIKYGMIDAIGSLDQAINRLHIMSETNRYKN